MSDAFWIILGGALVAISCGLPGAFMVLRKMSMVGDAISHAVLPGIVIAFLFSGARESATMLIGASALGVITTVIIEFLQKKAKLQSDASIGLTFTFLFAVGIIMISGWAGKVDLDQDCVLYGEIAYLPLDLYISNEGFSYGPKSIWILSGVCLIVAFVLWKGYKGFVITSFNPEYAVSIGISTVFWNYTLMSLVSLVTVVSFESVGAILVVAFLIVPPCTAFLLTRKLKSMLLLTLLFGVLSSIGGYFLAVFIDGSIAGAMAAVSGLLFTVAFVAKLAVTKFKRNYGKQIEGERPEYQKPAGIL